MFFYAHRDEDCRIERIAEGCGVSLSTLARCVQEATGLSPGIFFRRIRMEWAFRSLRSLDQAVIQVALAAGFGNHAAFSRAFRAIFGCSPTGARKVLSIHRELESIELAEPDIVEMDAFSVRGVVSQGSYFTSAARGWRDLAAKLGHVNDPASPVPLFVAMAMDDPHEGMVKDDEVRFFAGIASVDPAPAGSQWHKAEIPAGRYARFRFNGKLFNIGLAYHHIYGQWSQTCHWKLSARSALMFFDSLPSVDHAGQVLICVPLEVSTGLD